MEGECSVTGPGPEPPRLGLQACPELRVPDFWTFRAPWGSTQIHEV